ncbi:MAG: MFS transporter [Holosporales bacterium]|jgi:MFS family permease|nr:MFS transporter [Holosporales bacterium]
MKNLIKINNKILILALIVFFSTLATMTVTTVLPAFFENLGLTYTQIGYIEGGAASIAFLSKFLSGIYSDRIRKRKTLIVYGTALSIITKCGFSLVTGFYSLFIVQICDRFAKGLRSSPVDAMIADVSAKSQNSHYYGLKYTFFMIGSILGGYITYKILENVGLSFRLIFGIAIVPAIIANFLSIKFLNDAPLPPQGNITLKCAISKINPIFWKYLFILLLLMFARFSTSFLGIKAMNIGLPVSDLPRLSMLYDVCAVLASIFAVITSSNINKETLFKSSLVVHIFSHFAFLIASSTEAIFIGTILSGLHIGMSQSAILSIVSRFAVCENKATVFSIYYFVSGIGIFMSNALAGRLSNVFDSSTGAFAGGLFFCCAALFTFHIFLKKQTCNEILGTAEP